MRTIDVSYFVEGQYISSDTYFYFQRDGVMAYLAACGYVFHRDNRDGSTTLRLHGSKVRTVIVGK